MSLEVQLLNQGNWFGDVFPLWLKWQLSHGETAQELVDTAGHSKSTEREWVSSEFANLIAGFLDAVSPPDPTPAVAERCL